MTRQRPHCFWFVGALLFLPGLLGACLAPDEFLPLGMLGEGADSGVDSGHPQDSDSDGLPDTFEQALGTDPGVADTDGDGWRDGDEVTAGTNPLWAAHHPYAHGNYRIGGCRAVPETDAAGPSGQTQRSQDGTLLAYGSYEPGDRVLDAVFVDEWGQRLTLWGTCGLTVWLIVGAEDSPGLLEAVLNIGSLMADVSDVSWTPLLVLRADHEGGLPSQARLQTWREAFGLDGVPVVAPASAVQQHDLMAFDVDGLEPSTGILGPELRILTVDEDVGLRGGSDVRDWLE